MSSRFGFIAKKKARVLAVHTAAGNYYLFIFSGYPSSSLPSSSYIHLLFSSYLFSFLLRIATITINQHVVRSEQEISCRTFLFDVCDEGHLGPNMVPNCLRRCGFSILVLWKRFNVFLLWLRGLTPDDEASRRVVSGEVWNES